MLKLKCVYLRIRQNIFDTSELTKFRTKVIETKLLWCIFDTTALTKFAIVIKITFLWHISSQLFLINCKSHEDNFAVVYFRHKYLLNSKSPQGRFDMVYIW